MMRAWLGFGIVGVFVASIALAKPGVVVMRDGTKYEGEITERDEQVRVTIRGVETLIPRQDIASIHYTESFNAEFADRMGKLAEDDVAGRIALARWAFDQRQYAKAREALDSALVIDPNNREAYDLQNTITSQLRLEQSRNAPRDPAAPTPPPNPTGVERRMLSANDINLIRQSELQPSDRVNVRFEDGVERRYIQFATVQFSQFNALKPVDKALAILNRGDESMRSDVRILADPAPIAEYRRVIQPFVLNGCATSNCHGGPKGGDFILYNPADNEALSYTNYYILMNYRKKVVDPRGEGVFGSSDRKMVDRGNGAHSLLAQYGLPASFAALDHPPVAEYNGIFRSPDDLRFRQLTEWMDRSLKQPAPDYGIKFIPPGQATTRPTTQPTE